MCQLKDVLVHYHGPAVLPDRENHNEHMLHRFADVFTDPYGHPLSHP